MQIIRLEQDTNISSNYNKLLIFDSTTGKLKVYINNNYIYNKNHQLEDFLKQFNVTDFKYDDSYKIIINKVLQKSYSFPFKVYIDITDKCQLNCQHCLTKKLNLGNELGIDKIKEIIQECDLNGAFYVKLGGGEPFLHPNIFEIIKGFHQIGMMVSISTNGLLINSNVAKFLKEHNVKISVSLEGPKELNDEIRGDGHFDVALKALKVLREENCNVFLRVTLTRKMLNEEYIYKMINLAKENDVKLKISYCRPAGNAIDNDLLIRYEDSERYYKILQIINDSKYADLIAMDEGMQFYQDENLSRVLYGNRICGAANRSMHINSSGQLAPCVFLGTEYLEENSSYNYGDINNYWGEQKGIAFKNIRQVTIPENCEECSRLCKYECLGTRLRFNNNFTNDDPNCLRRVLKDVKK